MQVVTWSAKIIAKPLLHWLTQLVQFRSLFIHEQRKKDSHWICLKLILFTVWFINVAYIQMCMLTSTCGKSTGPHGIHPTAFLLVKLQYAVLYSNVVILLGKVTAGKNHYGCTFTPVNTHTHRNIHTHRKAYIHIHTYPFTLAFSALL